MIDYEKQPGRIRPTEHLRKFSALYPLAWKQINVFREDRGKDLPDWPEWCFCPLAGAYAVVSGGGGNRLNPDMIGNVSRVGALAAWRTTKTIFRFDSTLSSALVDTDLNKLPVDILYRLPQWCVYIEAPNLDWFGLPVAGFFAHLEHDANTGRAELRFLFDTDGIDGPDLNPLQIHLNYETLGEGIDAALLESKRHMIDLGMTHFASSMPPNMSRDVTAALRPALSLLLYLCSDTMDTNDEPLHLNRKRPRRAQSCFRQISQKWLK